MPNIESTPEIEVLAEMGHAWTVAGHGPRLRAVKKGAEALRERLATGPSAVSVRTLPLATVAYPSKYAFWGAALSPMPYVSMVHRALLVQFEQRGMLKSLLFNPTDLERARRVPFYARLAEKYGPAQKLLSKVFEPLESQLARLGLAPGDIDYVAFDHFHLQDVRGLLGTTDGRLSPRFPRAQLLAPQAEWSDWNDLHPMQQAWFIADGRSGVIEDRVLFTRDDLQLGDGVVLVRTPGHTSGNQTLFFKTARGVWGVSENGVAVDNWAPRSSRIAGIASMANHQDLDVVLNANTIEGGADQYTSMSLEKIMVDRVPERSEFFQMFPSSEAEPALIGAGLGPSYQHHAITHGEVIAAGARAKSVVRPGNGGFGAQSGHYQ